MVFQPVCYLYVTLQKEVYGACPLHGPVGGRSACSPLKGGVGPTQTIPAPMQPNANLGGGGMPGGPPQSTLGSLGPQPTDQASLDQARQELARIHPQAASQLSQVYSKEAHAANGEESG